MNNQKKAIFRNDIRLFGNARVMVSAALLAAMSFILGKFLQIPNPLSEIFRISFENLPIIFAGIAFGPAVGGTVGIAADLVGCLLRGYSINPFVTVGAGMIGIVSGIMAAYVIRKPKWLSVFVSTFSAHFVGSVIIKSFGLAVFYLSKYDMGLIELMLWRLLLYSVIGTAEFLLIYILLSHKAIAAQIYKLRSNQK